jgi:hypothetical protein
MLSRDAENEVGSVEIGGVFALASQFAIVNIDSLNLVNNSELFVPKV